MGFFDNIGKSLNNTFGSIGSAFKSKEFKSFTSTVGNAVSTVYKDVSSTVKGIASAPVNIGNKLIDAGSKAVDKAGDTLGSLGKSLSLPLVIGLGGAAVVLVLLLSRK